MGKTFSSDTVAALLRDSRGSEHTQKSGKEKAALLWLYLNAARKR